MNNPKPSSENRMQMGKIYVFPAERATKEPPIQAAPEPRDELKDCSEKLLRRVLIIFGAALILIFFYAENWFYGFLKGEQDASLTGSGLISEEALEEFDLTPHRSNIGLHEWIFCQGAKVSRFCNTR